VSYLVDRCPHCNKWIEQRTPEQNNLFHALCSDISSQRDWPRGSGVFLGIEKWKRLVMASFERTHERQAELYPALDGAGFDVIYRRTSRLSKKEFSELIEFTHSVMSELGVDSSIKETVEG